MKTYFNSAGISPDHDYSWKSIDVDNDSQKAIAYPDEISGSRDLLDSRSPSLLLRKNKGRVTLLVSGMEGRRKDYQRRAIRNSVVWVSEASKDEHLLRKLAIRALKSFRGEDSLPEDIDRLIQSEQGEGYRGYKVVSPARLKAEYLIKSIELGEKEPEKKKQRGRVYRRDDAQIQDLIDELKEYRLPKKDGPLVVVTGNTSQSTLKQKGVWRGLSKLVTDGAGQRAKWARWKGVVGEGVGGGREWLRVKRVLNMAAT